MLPVATRRSSCQAPSNPVCLLCLQLMEIKRLNASMATIRSQLNKYEEQVEECKRYQKFLDSVTPIEWQEQQRQLVVARQQQRHAAWLLECDALKKQKQDAKGKVSCAGECTTSDSSLHKVSRVR